MKTTTDLHDSFFTAAPEKLAEALLARFLRYTRINTQSDPEKADAGIMPSTEGQRQLAGMLAGELRAMGIPAEVDANSYLLARIPPSPGKENAPVFGLCAHLDTSPDAPGGSVQPLVHENYGGQPLNLPGGVTLDPQTDCALQACTGGTIVTSDGNTLLGADDKAGIAGILTLAEFLVSAPDFAHGPVEILFSPDEETGHGMDKVPLDKITAKAFYTVDGGDLGEIEDECFHAWKCKAGFHGVAAHLGDAKGKMVNALQMAAAFVSMLPRQESPETTEGREGYYCPLEMSGSLEYAEVTVFLRDFTESGISRRIRCVEAVARAVQETFPGGTVSVESGRQYSNMKEKLDEHPEVLALAVQAAEACGVRVRSAPIRGGTDGSRLTELGIPTPNLFTGGHNFHSRTEWISLDQMVKMTETLITLTKLWSERHV